MSAPKRVRWVCSECGQAVLAPTRMADDDVRRYCLPCSKSTGRLARRSSPRLERAKAQRLEAGRAQRTRKRQAEAERARKLREKRTASRERQAARKAAALKARNTRAGIDLFDEVERIWRLPYVGQVRPGKRTPRMELVPRSRPGSSGVSYGGRFRVQAGREAGDALAVIVHELCHEMLPRGEYHSERFYTVFRCLCREAYPDADFRWNELRSTRGRGVTSWAAGAIDNWIENRDAADAACKV